MGDHYVSDHSLNGQHKPEHVDDDIQDEIDSVPILNMYWFYEDRSYY